MHHPHRTHKVGSIATASSMQHHQAHRHHPLHRHRAKLAKLKPRRPAQPKKLAIAMAVILGLGVTAGAINSRGQTRYYPRTISEIPITTSLPAVSAQTKPSPSQATAKTTKAKPAISSTAIQHTPQVPINNTAQPYVGSLPDSLPVYNYGTFNFYYAGGREFATATGASVTLSQAQPAVPSQLGAENHSLIELAVSSLGGDQVVEVGWVVDKIMNGDDLPHLFVYHWVNGQTTCYNACGFVQTSTSIFPGQAVAVGTTGSYAIQFAANAWKISYNGSDIGYFPASLWGNAFTNFGFVETFGEVSLSANTTTSCVQMGNGLPGANAGASQISNFKLTGSNVPEALSPYATSPSTYTYGSASATGVSIGGPGSC